MVRQSSKTPAKPGEGTVPLGATIAAVCLLILIIGGLAWHYFGPQGSSAPTRPLTATEASNRDWMRQKAKELKGDFTKLSQDDQRRMYSIIGPRAPFDFLQAARHAQ